MIFEPRSGSFGRVVGKKWTNVQNISNKFSVRINKAGSRNKPALRISGKNALNVQEAYEAIRRIHSHLRHSSFATNKREFEPKIITLKDLGLSESENNEEPPKKRSKYSHYPRNNTSTGNVFSALNEDSESEEEDTLEIQSKHFWEKKSWADY